MSYRANLFRTHSTSCPRGRHAGGSCFQRRARHPLIVGAALLALTGCGRSVRWEFGRFEDLQPRAAAQQKLTFVYFKAWWSVDCTNFEEQVLLDPAVLTELDQMLCVPLNYHWDDKLAMRWGLQEPPAFAIVAPDANVLAKGMGNISKDQLLESIRAARNRMAPAASRDATRLP